MDTIFINSVNSKTSEYHVLVLKLTDKLDLRRGQKTVALSDLSIYCTWKNIKSSYIILLIMIISKIQEYDMLLYQTRHSVAY